MVEDLFSFADGGVFEIEKHIPIAAGRSSERKCSIDKERLYRTFEKMENGDSFAIWPQEGEHLIYLQNAVSGAASTWVSRLHDRYPAVSKRVFTTRQQKGGFVRCWRVQ